MSSDTLDTIDTFAADSPDEESELRALAHALRLAEGFKLIFARCNQPQHQRRVIAALHQQVPQLKIQEIRFDQPIMHLLDALRERLEQPAPDAILVSGLEYSLPTAADAAKTKFIANLNAARNSFPQMIPCPLVLFVPEYVLTAIAQGAPDFFSIRSGLFFFAATPGETIDTLHSLTSDHVDLIADLSLQEKRVRIAGIQNLLADYEALPADKRDLAAEMRLHRRLGIILTELGFLDEARFHFQRELDRAEKLHHRNGIGVALSDLGQVYIQQNQATQAEEVIGRSLAIFRTSNYRLGEAIGLSNLGTAYELQGRLTEAETIFQQSLTLAEELQDTFWQAQNWLNLGMICLRQQRFAEAETALNQSLNSFKELGHKSREGDCLWGLGNLFLTKGRVPEAISAYEQALSIFEETGSLPTRGRILMNLARVHQSQANMDEALKLAKRAAEVFAEIKDTNRLAAAQKSISEIEMASTEGS
ncbi:MAG: tetratricopeptide repeat protein [Blastocatellia bacterium]